MIDLSRLIRWSGMAFAASAVLQVVVALLHPDIFQGTMARTVIYTPWWVQVHALQFTGTLLTLLGVAGLYLAQAEKTGVAGLTGFLLSFVGLTSQAGLALFEAFYMPGLAASAPATLDWNGPIFAGTLPLVPDGLVGLYLLGYITLGVATLRAGVFSRRAALLFTLGAPLAAIFEGVFVPFLGIASVVVLATGQGLLGYELWATRTVPAREGQLAPGI